MNKKNYNQVFVLPNGKEVKVIDSYMGRYLRLPIQRIYEGEENKDKTQLMDESWREIIEDGVYKDRFYEKREDLFSFDTGKKYVANTTYVIAENKNWREYPAVKYYDGEHYSDISHYTKIEIILMAEEFSRRLFFDWKGNLNLYDYIENLGDGLWDELSQGKEFAKYDKENNLISLEFYTDKGDSTWFEFEKTSELERLFTGVKVVEFKENI